MVKNKNIKEWIASIIMTVSTSIIVFNNIGQSLQLIQIPLSKIAMYWIAGSALVAGAVWTLYLERVLKV